MCSTNKQHLASESEKPQNFYKAFSIYCERKKEKVLCYSAHAFYDFLKLISTKPAYEQLTKVGYFVNLDPNQVFFKFYLFFIQVQGLKDS